MLRHVRVFSTFLAASLVASAMPAIAQQTDDPATAAVRKSAEQVVQSFNAGKADAVAAAFLPQGEVIDEDGAVYQGPQEIQELLTAFFKQFPGAKLALTIESIRVAGPVAIEEGTRTITTGDGNGQSKFRYIGVWAKTEKDWHLASFRDFPDDPLPTANDHLQRLAWLVGDWVNEGVDGKVSISYRWSEDKNYLLGEFEMSSPDGPPRKSSQRIGWDPAAGKIHSWLFDADGGFADGIWTIVAEGIVIKASSVNPDGTTSSATMNITAKGKDHYVIQGTDRIVGDTQEDDFEITVARRPPASSK